MAGGWLEIEEASGARRVELAPGLTRLGGGQAEVTLAGVGADQIHIWDDPPRAVFAGRGAQPLLNGRPLEEAPLHPGDRIEWGGRRMRFRSAGPPAARSEEPSLTPDAPAEPAPLPAAARLLPEAEERIVRRVQAGLFVELGVAEPGVAKRWKQALREREFDPDACAREVLDKSLARTDDQRLLERAGRFLREALVPPAVKGVRGKGRQARQAARAGLACLLAQIVALVVYSAVLLALLLSLRQRQVSVDAYLDQLLERLLSR